MKIKGFRIYLRTCREKDCYEKNRRLESVCFWMLIDSILFGNGNTHTTAGMKKHIRIYLDFFGYSGYEYMPCEICQNPANQVHHIDPRGMGGSKQKDHIDNLLGCCFECHRKCESNEIGKAEQMRIHKNFMHGKGKGT